MKYDKRAIRSWSLLGIAPSIFINGVAEVMKEKENVYLVTADTGRYCGFQKLDSCLSDRIFNFGIAEQNMIGIAAGMALEGKQVYATTYAPFITFRCADQLRHLVGNCNLNIKAIGTAAGFTAASSGSALLAVNDISFVRAIPNMIVLSPADCVEAMKMIIAISEVESPVYMRFCGLTNLPFVYKEDFEYRLGKANVLREGSDVAILATGTTVVSEALKAANILTETGKINPTVVDIHTIKPLDNEYILSLQDNHNLIVSVEEHSIIGGLGSAISECLSMHAGQQMRQIYIGMEDKVYLPGDRKFMLEQCGIVAQKIADRIEKEINC